MSRILLVFLSNIHAKVGFGDVELLGLPAGIFCALGVDCASVVLTGVFFTLFCVTVSDIEGTLH